MKSNKLCNYHINSLCRNSQAVVLIIFYCCIRYSFFSCFCNKLFVKKITGIFFSSYDGNYVLDFLTCSCRKISEAIQHRKSLTRSGVSFSKEYWKHGIHVLRSIRHGLNSIRETRTTISWCKQPVVSLSMPKTSTACLQKTSGVGIRKAGCFWHNALNPCSLVLMNAGDKICTVTPKDQHSHRSAIEKFLM